MDKLEDVYKRLLTVPLIDRHLHFSKSNEDVNKDRLIVHRSILLKISEVLKTS